MTATTTTTSAPVAARTYAIDKTHSELVFQVRHLVTRVRGRFTDFDGTVRLDPVSPENSAVTVSINAATIDTGTADRDAHLRSEDFFAVETFPALTFASTRVTIKNDELFEVTGTLTIRGIAREVTLPVSYLGAAKDPWGNERVGFETEIAINRKDFGLTWNAALETGGFLVGDEVKISASVQAIAQ
jgi:polyisoprenoid-binding protein YceI